MAWRISTPQGAWQPITALETTAKHPVGTIVTARDDTDTLGSGEFIYLQGVASTVTGSIVEYDTSFQTGLASIAMAVPRPLAVAMAACTASYYGWYQISGLATVTKASALSIAANAAFGATSGAAVAAATALLVAGGAVATTFDGGSAVTTGLVNINRPHGPPGEATP